MTKVFFTLVFSFLVLPVLAFAQSQFQEDTFKTSAGNLKLTFIGHGTLMLTFGDTVVHIDPWTRLADYTALPKADIILVTHEHGDHLDSKAIDQTRKPDTDIIWTESCANQLADMENTAVMKNGDEMTVRGLDIRAVPAYNIQHTRGNGQPYHPKGVGNGYIISWGGKTVYIAGDTENTPEMKELGGIDIAFLPMNLPYTMTPEMAADAAKAFKPAVLYPYHYGDTDTSKLTDLLNDAAEIEVRIRSLQ